MKSINDIRLGETISALIKNEPGLTVTRLADEVGANRNALDNMISANAIPRGLKTVIKIANRFGLSLDQVVFGDTKVSEEIFLEEVFKSVPSSIEIQVDEPIKIRFIKKEKGI